ncbi:MAG: NAD-dependent epimerase [Legionellaceae bacterium]|nr:NAD-dependent epimerase [Legionellaceae bacterium]
MKILVTGCAGFIGMHVALNLLKRGDEVIGVDNLNDYYDVKLKQARLKRLEMHNQFQFSKLNLADKETVKQLFLEQKPERVVHLAAQAGVRYSLENPHAYIEANIQSFTNILEGCRCHDIEHLVYASSSSVYGSNTNLPFKESQNIDHPISLYAATKKANELMAHTYSHLFQLPTTGLRFFTVYGPWGRPDMALFKFTKAILSGEPIDLYNQGNMIRDFTYVDDIVEGVIRVLDKKASPDNNFDSSQPSPECSVAPYRIFNIGNNQPTGLLEFINAIEETLGIKAKRNYLPMQPGDVSATSASTEALHEWVGFKPNTSVPVGIERFVTWYREYYNV